MTQQPDILEGTWEEIKLHEQELTGRRLRVIIGPEVAKRQEATTESKQSEIQAKNQTKKLLGYGMFAHVPGGSEAFAREKQGEVAREDRKFD